MIQFICLKILIPQCLQIMAIGDPPTERCSFIG